MSPAPVPPRLRVVVVGNSVALMVRPAPRPGDGTYARHLELALRSRGHEATVANEGRWLSMVHEGFARWEETVAAHAPHAVILNYGFAECQPFVLPHPIHRWVLDWNTSLSPLRRRIREPVVADLRRALQWALPRAPARGYKLRPARFEQELDRLIRTTRDELQAAVLVLPMAPPHGWLVEVMPTIGDRVDRYNAIMERVVAGRRDPLVRMVPLEKVTADLGVGGITGDGLHFTSEGHRRLGSLLADEIEAVLGPSWL